MSHRRGDYFVTGTDTGVGKSLISAGLLGIHAEAGLSVCGMKPVAAGCTVAPEGLRNEDVELLRTASTVDVPRSLMNPVLLSAPLAPHIAAAREGVPLDLGHIQRCFAQIQVEADCVIVEGAGGFLVPLGPQCGMDDLAVLLGLPLILVVGMRLGCLNHALLTAEAIRARGLRLAGWIANRIDPHMDAWRENVQTLEDRLDSPLLGMVPFLSTPLNAQSYLDRRVILTLGSGLDR